MTKPQKAKLPDMRINFDSWPDCPRCGNRIGMTGYADEQGRIICHTCVRGYAPGHFRDGAGGR